MLRTLILLLLLSFLAGLIFIFYPVNFLLAADSGSGTTPPPGQGVSVSGELPNPLTSDDFVAIVNGIATWFYYVLSPIAVIMILYAAFLFLTSGGSEERVNKAKKTLLWAVVGVAIIIVGAGLTALIKEILGGT